MYTLQIIITLLHSNVCQSTRTSAWRCNRCSKWQSVLVCRRRILKQLLLRRCCRRLLLLLLLRYLGRRRRHWIWLLLLLLLLCCCRRCHRRWLWLLLLLLCRRHRRWPWLLLLLLLLLLWRRRRPPRGYGCQELRSSLCPLLAVLLGPVLHQLHQLCTARRRALPYSHCARLVARQLPHNLLFCPAFQIFQQVPSCGLQSWEVQKCPSCRMALELSYATHNALQHCSSHNNSCSISPPSHTHHLS